MNPASTQQEQVQAKPMQVGTAPGETDQLIEELSQTGVAAEGQDVERTAVPGPETSSQNAPPDETDAAERVAVKTTVNPG